MGICNHEWRAPRIMTNTAGEKFETLPVNHVCGKPTNHPIEHKCSCGSSTP